MIWKTDARRLWRTDHDQATGAHGGRKTKVKLSHDPPATWRNHKCNLWLSSCLLQNMTQLYSHKLLWGRVWDSPSVQINRKGLTTPCPEGQQRPMQYGCFLIRRVMQNDLLLHPRAMIWKALLRHECFFFSWSHSGLHLAGVGSFRLSLCANG